MILTHDEYADRIRELYSRYHGNYNQRDYAAMKRVVADNLQDYYADKIENKLLFETCKMWQSIYPRTCAVGLHAKYKAVLATIRIIVEGDK